MQYSSISDIRTLIVSSIQKGGSCAVVTPPPRGTSKFAPNLEFKACLHFLLVVFVGNVIRQEETPPGLSAEESMFLPEIESTCVSKFLSTRLAITF